MSDETAGIAAVVEALTARVLAIESSIGELVETLTSQIDTFEKLAGKVARIESRVAEIGMCEPQGKADVERVVGLECDQMRVELRGMVEQIRQLSDNAQEVPKRSWFGRGKR